MSRIYDNWERLVTAVLRREELWNLCHAPSISSHSSDFSFPSPLSDFSLEISPSRSCNRQNPISWSGESPPWANYIANRAEHESVYSVENSQVLKPGDIYVNNKLLDIRELCVLKSCPNPPTKLRPGSYWYDRYAGFWGKQGHKPSQIISVKLDVGGFLHPNASSGNTSVYINGREITKVELRMLKMIGVNCRRNKHFWMYEGGLHSEKRMLILNIWIKPGMMLLCSLLSLPFPPKSSHHASGELSVSDSSDHPEISIPYNYIGSGTTSFKQFLKLKMNMPVEGYYRRGKEIIRNASLP